MVQNMVNIDFRTFFAVTSQQWPLLKWNCDFWVPWNISDQIHRILCPNLVYFLRKCTKFSKIRPEVQYPLKVKQHKSNVTLLLSTRITITIMKVALTAHNWQKWKRVFLTCPCHKIYSEGAVGLKSCKLYFKNYDFCEYVKFVEISWKFEMFVNNCVIEGQI